MLTHKRTAAALTVLAATVLAAVALTAPAQPARSAPVAASPIQHIVVLDLENHSFDSLLGFWCDASPGRCPLGGMPASVTLSNGTVVTPKTAPDVVPLVDHSVASQLAAMDGGAMDGWENIPSKGAGDPGCTAALGWQCLTGYQPSQVPNITSLATQFAISDDFFSMADSPSWGGHLYAVAGTADGFTGDNPTAPKGTKGKPGWGCDSYKVASRIWGPPQPSCVPDFALPVANGGAFRPTTVMYVPTIMDRLEAAGLTWHIYGQATPVPGITPYGWSVCPSFAECLDGPQHANLVDESQFFTDASQGTLPSFSLITAGGNSIGATDSCHNGFSMTACDNYVGQVASAVMNSPDWSSTALLITWDDFGGFYDQVYPGTNTNPDGTQEGPRLPLIAVSPFAAPASTDSTPASFASILAFTEHVFGLPPLEANDASAYPLSGMFNLGAPPHLGNRPRMVVRPIPKGDRIDWAQGGQGS